MSCTCSRWLVAVRLQFKAIQKPGIVLNPIRKAILRMYSNFCERAGPIDHFQVDW